ncbi:MAG: hypothetical protein NT062_39690 [Proteobacteria bacterium]|nr:hypothetical protein [Pseudomonadota bacterium]
MSDHQRFSGSLQFEDAVGLELGLDALFGGDEPENDRCVVMLPNVRLDRATRTLAIEFEGNRGGEQWYTTRARIGELAGFAASGVIETAYDGQPCPSIEADPRYYKQRPLHRRWDAYFAARAGDAAWLRELDRALLATTYESFYGANTITTMHLAATADSAEVIEVLVAAGVAADAPSPMGPPIADAGPNATRALLAAGADPNGAEVLLSACKRPTDDVARLLLDAGAVVKPDEYLAIACACAGGRHLELLRVFARDPAFAAVLVDARVIAAAIEGGELVIVDYLLEQGATLPDPHAVASRPKPAKKLAKTRPAKAKKAKKATKAKKAKKAKKATKATKAKKR